ncbi:MAG TPA: type IV pilus modification protein PilV [Steroidobacteraceae bacterium]|jgi:type IV pilus assembly protein PilV|nr:type IV pilus modification protein PilV [Steroidobacteraceae bacterium]
MAVRNLVRRLHGFTIVEVLAALLVMAVGIIGIAALYSDQVQTNPEAQLHREAAELAEQIANRIRSTKEGHAGFATTIGVLCDQQSKLVLPQDIAAREAACWEDEVERKLPSGLGTITRDTLTNPPTYVIAVSWSVADAGTASYVIRVPGEKNGGN